MCWLRIIRNQIVPQHKKRMIILSKIEIDKLLDNNILDPELSQYYSKYFFWYYYIFTTSREKCDQNWYYLISPKIIILKILPYLVIVSTSNLIGII